MTYAAKVFKDCNDTYITGKHQGFPRHESHVDYMTQTISLPRALKAQYEVCLLLVFLDLGKCSISSKYE